MKSILSTALLTIFTSGTVLAESQWGLGLGGVVSDQGYVDLGTETQLVPVIFYQSEDVYLFGPEFGYKLASYTDLELNLIGKFRFDGFKEDDGDIFKGMKERSGPLDLGFSAEYETQMGDFSLSFLTDGTSEHKGNEISVGYSLPFHFDTYEITPFVSATHQSQDLVDYYYGVRVDEVTASRAFYEGKSTTNYEIGVNSRWQFGQHHNLVANISYESFGSEIKDSPLVDKSGGMKMVVGYMYVF